MENITLADHQIKCIALSLLKEWQTLEEMQKEFPMQDFDFVTMVQCFSNLGLSRVNKVLNESDNEYIDYHLWGNISKFDCAKTLILTGKLPHSNKRV